MSHNNLIDTYPWRVSLLRSLQPAELYTDAAAHGNEVVASDVFCTAASRCHVAVGFANGLIRLLRVDAAAAGAKSNAAGTQLCISNEPLCQAERGAHLYAVNALQFVPRAADEGDAGAQSTVPSSLLVSCSRDGTAALWHVDTGRRLCSLRHDSGQSIRSCCVSFDGRLLATAGDDQTAVVWRLDTKVELARTGDHDSSVTCCALPASKHYLVTGSADGDLFAWHIAGGRAAMRAAGLQAGAHDLGVTCAAFAPTRRADTVGAQLLASGGQDNAIKVWWVAETEHRAKVGFKLRHTCAGHEQSVMCISFDAGGELIASGGGDKLVFVWDVSTGAPLCRMSQHKRYVTCVSLMPPPGNVDARTPAGRQSPRPVALLVSGSNDKTVSLCALYNNVADEVQHKISVKMVDRQDKCASAARHHRQSSSNSSCGGGGAAALRNEDGSLLDEFLCPITREVMAEPVVAADGYSYEREAILGWINAGKRLSPMSNEPLPHLDLTDNLTLRALIRRALGAVVK